MRLFIFEFLLTIFTVRMTAFTLNLLVLCVFIESTQAMQTLVEYEFDFMCGRQPVTGELVVHKGGVLGTIELYIENIYYY